MKRPLAGLAAIVLWAACTEHLPRPFEDAPTGTGTLPEAGEPDVDGAAGEAGCEATAPLPRRIAFQEAASVTLDSPVEVVLHDGAFYVLEQDGRVVRVSADGGSKSTVLDITARITAQGEAGLLGIAFHPRFAQNGFVYLYFTAPFPDPAPPEGAFQSVVARYTSADGGLTLDLASEKRILVVDQPYSNHNGGTIAFGVDGFLYLGLGDGGAGGDPQNRAQRTDTLLGKMVRIDVDGGDPYAIPATNPFADGAGGKPEIWALGLRNPYRFRFDPVTNDLWAGDVGQGSREEIDRIVRGGNYGWKVREGKTCYAAATCPSDGLIDPVVDHGRSEATSITGGVVYRGTGVPALTGKYVYGDFGWSSFWAIPVDAPSPVPLRLDDGTFRVQPAAFALDGAGEILVLDYAGKLLRIVAPETPPAAPPDAACP